jgi:hypothetical protein
MLASATGSTAPGTALLSSASSLNVPAGPRKPARGRSGRTARAGLIPTCDGAVARHREPHGLGLLRRELEFAAPGQHALAVHACLVAVVDARQHDPRPFVVEQGDRHRLVTGQLVVGVVADQRAVRERPPQRRLRCCQTPVQARRSLLDVVAQGFEGLLHRGRVRHQVPLLAVADHQPLRLAQASHAHAQHRARQQRGRRHGCGGDRDDPLRVGDRSDHRNKLAAGGAAIRR